jgi:hypothetical protein
MKYCIFILLAIAMGCQTQPVKIKGDLSKLSDEELQKKYTALLDRIVKTTKKKSLREIPAYLESCLKDSVFEYWYDTPWDFYGTTEQPRKGKIACGYFVTTTLKHLGLNIDRVFLAQQASSVLINEVCDESSIKIFTNSRYQKMKQYVSDHDGHIFIAGLDNHVGFIVKEGSEMYFIHSSGISPHKVVKEKLDDANLLVYSKYHMVGHLNFAHWAKGLKNAHN